MADSAKTARIILEDGTEFEGTAFGHESSIAGEIMWYVGPADMNRIASDPALKGAILVVAQPAVGIVGIPDDATDALGLETQFESSSAQIAGLVVETHAEDATHHAAQKTLGKWLKKQQVTGISDIDTRALIQRLRERGSMRAKILVSDAKEVTFSSAGTHNQPENVSIKKPTTYGSGEKTIIAVDCGIRNSTIRSLAAPDITVKRVPASYDYGKDEADGIFVGGGPGDPTSCEKTIATLRAALEKNIPVFATGQGAVVLAIAAGAAPYRMPNGHRASSVPVIDLANGRCYLTSQNHGYGVRDESLPSGWEVTFLNDEDRSIEGFASAEGRFVGVLFHPEGYPGPHDTDFLFGNFLEIVRNGEARA